MAVTPHGNQSELELAVRSLEHDITSCRACPRLVWWREKIAQERRAAYTNEQYWGKPVAGFGDLHAKLLVIGLAPAAHGANRTGRMFTGDRSGDWLFAALHAAGYASQKESQSAGDSMQLRGVWLTAAVRCAPPKNKPVPSEQDACAPFLVREMELLHEVRVVIALGHFAYRAVTRITGLSPRPRFAHGAEVTLPAKTPGSLPRTLICSYHPSQQNTFTGRLTMQMLSAVFERARDLEVR